VPRIDLNPTMTRSDHAQSAESLSAVLAGLAERHPGERVSVADIIGALGDRAYGALMFIFALPNVVPTPPGTSLLLGIPLLFLAAQLAVGRAAPWLPAVVAQRSMRREDFARVIARAAPMLARAERLMRPRLGLLTSRPAEQLAGLICAVLAMVVLLPIPLGNMLPAVAICLYSLALLERDGLAALAATGVALVSMAIVSGVVYAMVKTALFVLSRVLGLV
jgi:hypothetical protein